MYGGHGNTCAGPGILYKMTDELPCGFIVIGWFCNGNENILFDIVDHKNIYME